MLAALERIFIRVNTAAINLEKGLNEARALCATQDLDDRGIHALAAAAINASRGEKWRDACVLWRIVLEALEHPRTSAQRGAALSAAGAWLNIATAALCVHADGRILADARRRGEWLANALHSLGQVEGEAFALHQLGVLLLDPYVYRSRPDDRSRDRFMKANARWERDALTSPLDLALAGDPKMPAITDALKDAAIFLQRAAKLRKGRDRALTLKALVGVYFWRGVAKDDLQTALIVATANESLSLFNPQEDPEQVLWLQTYLSVLDHDSDPSPVPSLAVEQGTVDEQDGEAFNQLTLRGAHAETPAQAIGYFFAALRVASKRGDEAMQFAALNMLTDAAAHKLKINFRPKNPLMKLAAVTRKLLGAGRSYWESQALKLITRADTEEWLEVDRALGCIRLAFAASGHDQDEVGIALIDHALARDSDPGPDVAAVLAMTRAFLNFNAGARDANKRRFGTSFGYYMRATGAFFTLDMPGRAKESFTRAMGMFDRCSPPYPGSILNDLANHAPAFEIGLDGVQHDLRRIWQQALGDAAFGTQEYSGYEVMAQAAKAASLVRWRISHTHSRVLELPTVGAALENWRSRVSEIGIASAPPFEWDLEKLLTAYQDDLTSAGDGAAGEIFNLRRQFDKVLSRNLGKVSGKHSVNYLTADDLRAALPQHTVLLSLLPCDTSMEGTRFLAILTTREGISIRRYHSEDPVLNLTVDGVWKFHSSELVAEIRRELGSEIESSRLLKLLSAVSVHLGAVEDELRSLHAGGYRHLCINPFGALHFCPLPLILLSDRHLAEDWIVTHLASLGLLCESKLVGETPQRSGGAVIGVTYDGSCKGLHGLKALPFVEKEVRAVAAEIGCEPDLNEKATPSRFNSALNQCRFVHIASHGKHDPAAPSFQSLYLYPEAGHDGIYRAFEVLQNQLHGLELITLSACETSLGRIDIADNPRGLQAFLFAAGAQTVISCLWQVHDDTAEFFFAHLYRELGQGSDKLHAFASAQTATREKYPALEDWGAFQYSGTW